MFVVCHPNDINDKGQRNIANTSLWRHLGVEILFCSLIENKMILKTREQQQSGWLFSRIKPDKMKR